jgi:hypothetical protein
MNETLEVRALKALVNKLDEKVICLEKEIERNDDKLTIENTRTNTLIKILQNELPKSARLIIEKAVLELNEQGDIKCDLLKYYDETYEE